MPDPWNLFYSYSHADTPLRDELAKFLAPLRHQRRIVEWYDRRIEPGLPWESAISDKLHSADVILLLISADFLASDYCFGVEMEVAMERMKNGDARVVPILLKPCLWKESRFSDLQLLPRNARPIASWPSHDDAFADVAGEIDAITKEPPLVSKPSSAQRAEPSSAAGLSLVRDQVIAYARLYERTRQQMRPSGARTAKMNEIFQRMKALANAAFPLLPEFAASHSPGEKLVAVSILQCFSSPNYPVFLVDLIRSEKPFVGFHAARALEFAVSATEPRYYPQLRQTIDDAIASLQAAPPGFDNGRLNVLTRARADLEQVMTTVAPPADPSQP